MKGVALITGGSGSLGAATARVLDEGGFTVAVHYVNDKDGAAEVCASLSGHAMVVRADVSSWEDVKDMTERVEAELGPVEVLVNSAAVRKDGLMASQPVEEWRQTIATNLVGTFHTCRAVLPGMLRRRSGRVGSRGQTAYSASKAGVIGMTRSLALECGKRGVTVNAVSPGYMDTKLTDSVPTEIRRQFLERTAVKRLGDPDEIAAAVRFVVGAPYMTGQVLSLDGGLSIS